MSILHVVRCEQYEQCKQEFSFGTNTVASDFAPDTWITLFEGNPRLSEGQHFCSKECLFNWIIEHWQVGDGFAQPAQQPQEQPACKARRFLLVDGETAELVNGIKWGNGSVTLEGDTPFQSEHFTDWDALKAHYEGSGVQWIDQEVAE